MRLGDLPVGARYEQLRWTLLAVASIALAFLGAWLLQSAIPRHIVLASGLRDGMYHQYAQRYKEILARDGVTVEERMTGGADENERLLRDPHSGVDVAFVHGGVVRPAERGTLVMLAALYYEPLWIFYRDTVVHPHFDELRHKRLAVGSPGSGVRAFMEPLLAANNITSLNSELVPLVNLAALRALQAGQVDAAFLVGPAQFPAIWQALHDPDLKLMSLARAEAYQRKFPYITKLTLPPGTIDLAAAHSAAGREADRHQGDAGCARRLVAGDRQPAPRSRARIAWKAGLLRSGRRVSEHRDGGPAGVGRCESPPPLRAQRASPLPAVHVAAYLERLIVLLVPVLFVIVPLTNVLPRLIRWRDAVAHLPLVRRVGTARTRCRNAHRHLARRAMAGATWSGSSRPPRGSVPH